MAEKQDEFIRNAKILVVIPANLLIQSILLLNSFVHNILDILKGKCQFSGVFYDILLLKSYL